MSGATGRGPSGATAAGDEGDGEGRRGAGKGGEGEGASGGTEEVVPDSAENGEGGEARTAADRGAGASRPGDGPSDPPADAGATDAASSSTAGEALLSLLAHGAPDEEILPRIDAVSARAGDGYGNSMLMCAVWLGASDAVLSALWRAHPAAIEAQDCHGNLPLHCTRKTSEPAATVLLEAYPDAIKRKNNFGQLPLHKVAEYGAPAGVVALLLEAYPDGVKQKDNEGRLPLQTSVQFGASIEVVKLLLKTYPDGVEHKNSYGNRPLHVAAKHNATEEVVKLLLDACPGAMKQKGNEGFLPLHQAACRGASRGVLAMLLEAYPGAVRQRTLDRKLPLHLAVEHGASEAVTMALLDAYPEAAKESGPFVRMPLHYAAKHGASEVTITALLDAHPAAIKQVEDFRNTPLHFAVRYKVSTATITTLLRDYPSAAKQKDGNGNLPLHIVAMHRGSKPVVEVLLEAYPGAAKEKNSKGDLPLHLAVEHRRSESIVKVLLAAYPDGARKSRKSLMFRLLSSDSSCSSPDLIYETLKADMPFHAEDGSPVEHRHSWTTCLASGEDIACAAVRRILAPEHGGYAKFIVKLVGISDERGRIARAVAAQKQKEVINRYFHFCGQYEIHLGAPEHRSSTSIVLRATDYSDKTNYEAIFDEADTNNSGKLTKEQLPAVAERVGLRTELFLVQGEEIYKGDFVGTCDRQLGDGHRRVVIKLMQAREQWECEKRARKEYKLDPRFVVGELTSVPSDEDIRAEVEQLRGGLGVIQAQLHDNIRLGTYAIIMEAAERNLLQIHLQERPDITTVRNYLRQIFRAVQHMHSQKLMHGDLKLLNIVRFQQGDGLRIIDLDACVRICRSNKEGRSYAGAKFSSACLPPEMIFQFETEAEREHHERYWRGEGEGLHAVSDELWKKVKPKQCKEGRNSKWYAVKSYRVQGGEPVLHGLSHDLVEASESIDVWALGVMAFALLTGQSLVPSDRDDDCADGVAMSMLCEWGSANHNLEDRLREINNVDARELVRKMLQRDCFNRPTLSGLLNDDPFLDPYLDSITLDDTREPSKIDAALGIHLRDSIIKLIPGRDVERHYPMWATSYATGHREGDDEGCGPGMWLNAKIIKLANSASIEVPMTGMLFRSGNWKAYTLRLNKKQSDGTHTKAAKVMVVLLTKALYTSNACFMEIHLALENKMKFILLRCEEGLPTSTDWWKQKADPERHKVVRFIENSNSIPPPGSTIFTAPRALKSFLDELKVKIR